MDLLLARNRAIDEIRSTRFQKQRQSGVLRWHWSMNIWCKPHKPDETLTADSSRLEIQKAFEIAERGSSEDHGAGVLRWHVDEISRRAANPSAR